MNASENVTDVTIAPERLPPAPPLPCSGTYFPDQDCVPAAMTNETRFLAFVVLALAVIACVLCLLACMLTVLVHKLSVIWVKSLVRPPASTEPSDDPSKALLQETKSSLRDPEKPEGKKKKKTSFAEDEGTSCAATRDVDEEDL